MCKGLYSGTPHKNVSCVSSLWGGVGNFQKQGFILSPVTRDTLKPTGTRRREFIYLINTFIFTGSNFNKGSIGIGFAIPINTAKRIAKELKTSGSIDRSFTTGLVVQPITRSMIRHLDIPFRDGVIVVHVDRNSPAQKAGISIGDIIVTAANKKVNSPSDIRNIIAEKDLRSGDKIKFRIYRENVYLNIKLRLGTYK